jgi:twitching motility protein PilJ
MKTRLSSTIWLLVIWTSVALFAVLGLAYQAGIHSGGVSVFQGGITAAGPELLLAAAVALFTALGLLLTLPRRVLGPLGALSTFSERFAAGDHRAKAEVPVDDEFGVIAENLNRTAARVSKAYGNQEAQDSLQRSITDLLNLINQVARGDLTLRGKVTNDALGNVADSINLMLDNFTTVIECVRKAAVDVSTNANRILASTDEMNTGTGQQDQEITNTSSAVEELTV